MKLPEELVQSLAQVKDFNVNAFLQVHEDAVQSTSIRINPLRKLIEKEQSITEALTAPIQDLRFAIQGQVPWSDYGYYLSQRPSFTFDPLFHGGCYYVQEASSMFLEQALKQTFDLSQPLKILDLCAAPGGKSTHIQSLISTGSLLVSNEVIKNRVGVLRQNIIKWGCSNVVVTNNDPQHFQKLEGFFDVMIVDAPCSGSGLFRKDKAAIEEWSTENVALCCGRQKRIIRDAIGALKENGILIYSTCSYSKEEDEDIADWLVQEAQMQSIALDIQEEWGIVETGSLKTSAVGYRFFPDKLKGEGFYLACFRKTSGNTNSRYKAANLDKAAAKEQAVIKPWLKENEMVYLKEHFIYALPAAMVNDYSILKQALNICYAGTAIGEVMKDKLVPDHGLACSTIISSSIPANELSYEDSIRYLKKGDFNLNTETKGWQLVCFRGHNLGWINALPNRINNYYPKELRILKQSDDISFEK